MDSTSKVSHLSQECQRLFDVMTADMTAEERSAVALLIGAAYRKGHSEGFCKGIDKGVDICNGSVKVQATYPTTETPAARTGIEEIYHRAHGDDEAREALEYAIKTAA